jgi:hypothetical protein|eukprot:SAG25_NODE_1256_length_3486_cov_8.791911_2_plen_43_part_00
MLRERILLLERDKRVNSVKMDKVRKPAQITPPALTLDAVLQF